MTKNFASTIRLLLFTAIILVASQHAVLAQNGAQKTDHVAKIQEVLTLAHKYRLFNGTALVTENGRVVYKQGSAWQTWSGEFQTLRIRNSDSA
jgi:hypothetical protein